MYAVISCPFVSRTLAIFRTAEFGFRGFAVVTFVQTPRLKGDGYRTVLLRIVLKPKPRATVLDFCGRLLRLFRTS